MTIDRVAGIPVRHPELVAAGRHYGIQVVPCVPFDPESKGGSEATVRIAKADPVPTAANLLDEYATFANLRAACDAFCEAVNAREHRETRSDGGATPSGKTFEAWDPKASAIPAEAQWALRSLDWIGRAENLVLVGPSGTGKSHFAEAICHAAIDVDLRVSWFTLESLTAVVARSKVDATTAKVVARNCYAELIVVDDIGLLPAGEDEAEALYRLVDAAYERRSLILTSNLHPGRFDTIFPKGLATAAVDRLLHHAHVVVTVGQSRRLADALEGRGVQPLAAGPPAG